MPLTTATWINNTQNLIFTGPTGSGKTYIAEAVGLQACILGFSVMKIRYPILFEEIHAAKGTGTYLRYLKKLSRIKILIIDDFLMQPIETADCGPLLDVIEEKEQTGSIIITTQFPIEKWHVKLPDPTVADAICDWLTHGKNEARKSVPSRTAFNTVHDTVFIRAFTKYNLIREI